MINSIHIKGFRGIESGSMNKFRQFNIFVGANNAGKSAVMEAIYLASTVDREVGLLREDDDGQRSNAVLLSTVDLLGNNPFKLIAGKHGDLGDLLNLSRIGEAFLIVDVADSKSPLQEFELDIGKSKLSIENIALFAFDSSKENEDLAKLIWQDVGANGHSPLLTDGSRTIFCWYPSLTYYSKGSASWTIAGQSPAAQHTFFAIHPLSKAIFPLPFIVASSTKYRAGRIALPSIFLRFLNSIPTLLPCNLSPFQAVPKNYKAGFLVKINPLYLLMLLAMVQELHLSFWLP